MASKNSAKEKSIRSLSVLLVCAAFPFSAQAQMIPGYQPAQNQNPSNASTFGNNNGFNSNNFNPIANTESNPYASTSIPKSAADYWTGVTAHPVANPNLLNSGTVLTGVLQEDISSKKSKAGDVFSIMLPEDYTVIDRLLIPKYSKFVGTVVAAAPARKGHGGTPGTLQVSIQTLVAQDGTSVPVNAFIDYNPNQNKKTDIKKSRGVPVGEWGKSAVYSLSYAAGGLGSRLGVPFLYKGQSGKGAEFSLSKGELLPVRLTASLDVTPLIAGNKTPIGQNSAPPVASPIAPTSTQIDTSQSGGQTSNDSVSNMMPGTDSPAGPEPF